MKKTLNYSVGIPVEASRQILYLMWAQLVDLFILLSIWETSKDKSHLSEDLIQLNFWEKWFKVIPQNHTTEKFLKLLKIWLNTIKK
jgi:hypothetical protein